MSEPKLTQVLLCSASFKLSEALRGHRQKVHPQKVQELRPCEAGKVQEDLQPVRSVAASAPAASQGRLRRLRRQQQVQDQEEEMQQESAGDHEEVQKALQEGPQEEEAAVQEDLLRARLPGHLMKRPFRQRELLPFMYMPKLQITRNVLTKKNLKSLFIPS